MKAYYCVCCIIRALEKLVLEKFSHIFTVSLSYEHSAVNSVLQNSLCTSTVMSDGDAAISGEAAAGVTESSSM